MSKVWVRSFGGWDGKTGIVLWHFVIAASAGSGWARERVRDRRVNRRYGVGMKRGGAFFFIIIVITMVCIFR